MWQVIEMTHSQKVEMYQAVEKDELIEMLIQANNVIEILTEVKNVQASNSNCILSQHNFIQKDTYWKSCTHCGMLAPLR